MLAEERLDRELMRKSNTKYVLKTLLTAKEVTKPYLANMTGISAMSIGRICDELIQSGLLKEADLVFEHTRSGGRPPMGITMNVADLLCCGVHIGKRALHMGIVDPYGRIFDEKRISCPPKQDFSPEIILPWAQKHIQQFLEKWRGKGLLSNVGLVISGVVNAQKGELEYSANLKWKKCAITEHFKSSAPEFDYYLENDAKALAQAEYQCGANAGIQNIVILNMDDGIGSAAVLHGKLYRASHNMAGEIGHIILNPSGKVCECGQVGCLQTYLAKDVILNEARMMHPNISFKELVTRSQQSEPFAAALINQVVDYAGIAINLLANMYAPEVILISGSTIWESPLLRDLIEKNYKNRLNGYMSNNFQLKFDSFGPCSYVVGAAAIAFAQVIETLDFKHVC